MVKERFSQIMIDFSLSAAIPKWEWGYMGATLEKWYTEGLPRGEGPSPYPAPSTPTTSLYLPAWNTAGENSLPPGITVSGGGFYSHTQGFPYDNDIRNTLQLDSPQRIVDVNLLFEPVFSVEKIDETEDFLIYRDLDGIKRKYLKKIGIIPTVLEPLISDWKNWNKLKAERLSLDTISNRFPKNWPSLVETYKNRDFVLTLGGYPYGYFGTLTHILGYENLFFQFYDNPDLIHDIQKTFTDIWIAVYREVLTYTDIDLFVFWEDMSSGTGSMISNEIFREFLTPYYKKMTDFLKSSGVSTIFVDTDGDCTELIPLFLEAGITGVYPMQTGTGMDLVKIRKEFPKLQMMGGFPKETLALGRKEIDTALDIISFLTGTGRFIPFCDHGITPNVSWQDFAYYRKKLNSICERK